MTLHGKGKQLDYSMCCSFMFGNLPQAVCELTMLKSNIHNVQYVIETPTPLNTLVGMVYDM